MRQRTYQAPRACIRHRIAHTPKKNHLLGASTEIAVAGNEGLVGIALFTGGETTPSRAVVQSALLLRYTETLLTQMTQTVWAIV